MIGGSEFEVFSAAVFGTDETVDGVVIQRDNSHYTVWRRTIGSNKTEAGGGGEIYV